MITENTRSHPYRPLRAIVDSAVLVVLLRRYCLERVHARVRGGLPYSGDCNKDLPYMLL